MDVQHVGRT